MKQHAGGLTPATETDCRMAGVERTVRSCDAGSCGSDFLEWHAGPWSMVVTTMHHLFTCILFASNVFIGCCLADRTNYIVLLVLLLVFEDVRRGSTEATGVLRTARRQRGT